MVYPGGAVDALQKLERLWLPKPTSGESGEGSHAMTSLEAVDCLIIHYLSKIAQQHLVTLDSWHAGMRCEEDTVCYFNKGYFLTEDRRPSSVSLLLPPPLYIFTSIQMQQLCTKQSSSNDLKITYRTVHDCNLVMRR